ncbi:sulfotransferase family 2 domain-containing protein [Marinimicrobium agarilyticum]|uniref:sulfotransferase family 2 domain-containing protein n=1 Tax=Marinimicrobium agarilyticum TaxID=306546 RepID=UPI000686A2AD|nr:sulfotransferase family 2 domain-containing protein [Marinimicrobium agarilyticum]
MDNLIFLHIPKTGGSTFHTMLNKRYPAKSIHNVFASKLESRDVLALKNMNNSKKSKIKLLKGHMPFGLHELLNSPFSYITFLRDPVERVISQYYYIKKNSHNPNHKKVHQGGMTLRDFVESGVVIGMNSGQCRFLTGAVDRVPYMKEDDVLFYQAKENIDKHFSWVGVTERFDESVLLLSKLMHWSKRPYYFKQNISKLRGSNENISQEDLNVIRAYNKADINLYKYANERLDSQIKLFPKFYDDLNALTEVNIALSSRWGWLPAWAQSWFI